MIKFLQVVGALIVFAACFGLAFIGFDIYLRVKSAQSSPQSYASGGDNETSSTTGRGALSSIVDDYKKSAQATKIGDATGATGVAAQKIAAPVRTPPPDQKTIREWATGHKWVALTFDDGPNPEFTPRFIDLLNSKKVRATFFLLGPNVKTRPDIVKAEVQSGFEVANHTWNHVILNKLSPEKVQEEMQRTNAEIVGATGVTPTLLRPPYGSANKKVQDVCDAVGLKIIDWSIDTNDWKTGTTADTITSEIMKNIRDGSIVLMHDRYDKSYEATARVIDEIRARGYEFVTVSELLGLRKFGEAQATSATEVASAPPAEAAPAPATSTPEVKLPAPSTSVEVPAPAMTSQTLPIVSPDKVTQAPGR